MTRDQWRRIEAIVDRVLDADPAERARVIEDACGDDAELRAEVESFLASCDEAETMFEAAPSLLAREAFAQADDWRDRDSLEPGDLVGAYRIVEPLGAGGMGAVYLAERADGAFDKRVALKVIKRGLDTDEIVRRFRNERQIVARLEHPNIAALLDGGATTTGLPYFAMELAPGQPIDDYCDTNQLGITERLRLFLTVCDAVRYAHRNLVVHRDLKPSNILVADGEPKLLDFGIAKVLDPETGTSQTATRLPDRRLTPEYAAPEQVLGLTTTTATDVYALGVILYELIAGAPPYRFENRSLHELEHVICTVDPPPPSEVVDAATAERIPSDLDAIVLKALHKEPERRYGGAAELADDLERFLEGRPVLARPDTGIYRLQKFVRRNFAVVGLSAAAALTLVAGTVMTGWMAVRAARESAQRELEAERATASRDFLVSMLSSLNPDLLGGQREFTHDDLIRFGIASIASVGDVPELQATVMNTLAQVVFNLGDHAHADSLYGVALELLEGFGDHPERAVSLMGRGEVLRQASRFVEAEAMFEEALTIRRHLRVDSMLVAESLISLAAARYNRADAMPPDSAEPLFALAEAGNQEALEMSTVTEEFRAHALEGLGDIALGRAEDAALRASERGTDAVASAENIRADERALLEEARGFYERAVEEGAKALHTSPPVQARRLWGLARVLGMLGSHQEALAAERGALDVLVETYGQAHPHVASAWYRLGARQFSAGRAMSAPDSTRAAALFIDAAATFAAAATAYHDLGGAYRDWAVHSQQFRGQALLAAGDAAGALRELGSAHAGYVSLRREASSVLLDRQMARTKLLIGDAHASLRELVQAAVAYTEAHVAFSGRLNRPATADSIAAVLIDVYERLGIPDSAAAYRARRGATGVQDPPRS